MTQTDKATPTDWRDGALKEYGRDMQGMQRQLDASKKQNSEMVAALEKAEHRLLWARDLAGQAAELLTDYPAAQELLDEITSSEYVDDDLTEIRAIISQGSEPSKTNGDEESLMERTAA